MRTMSFLSAITLAALALPTDAEACGGFFCNRDLPVDQSKERILFAIDDDAGTVEAHIQVFYQGEAEDFAWILPTPGVPSIDPSSDVLFDTLEPVTRPYFWLDWQFDDDCQEVWYDDVAEADGVDFDDSGFDKGPPNDPNSGVTILDQGQVGNYVQTTLQAESAEALTTWLQDNDYDLPKDYLSKLGSYVVPGNSFIALKLAKNKDAGDITPIKVTWPGDAASIPITLTSVAAVPDMRLEVYVLADHRAVPDNYLHVRINEAAIDWLNGGSNYEETISMAADEAGGHAFATDYSGKHEDMGSEWWFQFKYLNTAALALMDTPAEFMNGIISQGFPANQTMLGLLTEWMPLPEGSNVEPTDFYDCVECYPELAAQIDFDAPGFADALQETIVEPLENGRALLDRHSTLTRLTSSMSPDEMDEDPFFILNRQLPPVSNQHQATLFHDCDESGDISTAKRTLQLSDGRELEMPSQEELTDYPAWLNGLSLPAAGIIEDLNGADEGEILQDQRDVGLAPIDGISEVAGCGGCSNSQTPRSLLALFGLGGFLGLRRRK
ncbi:MAG: DUF2330 domain-containing protein [Myxococcota bacterium]